MHICGKGILSGKLSYWTCVLLSRHLPFPGAAHVQVPPLACASSEPCFVGLCLARCARFPAHRLSPEGVRAGRAQGHTGSFTGVLRPEAWEATRETEAGIAVQVCRGSSKSRPVLVPVLEAGSPGSPCWQLLCVTGTHFLVCRPPSRCWVLTWQRGGGGFLGSL